MNGGYNWFYAQIAAIAQYACGPDGLEEDIGALRNLCLAFLQASDRIEREIERRLDVHGEEAEGRRP